MGDAFGRAAQGVGQRAIAGHAPTEHDQLAPEFLGRRDRLAHHHLDGGVLEAARDVRAVALEVVARADGEAFDKTAKLMGLPYPGGKHIEALAREGEPGRFKFTKPMLHSGQHLGDADYYDFSFSGLKTAVLLAVRASASMCLPPG